MVYLNKNVSKVISFIYAVKHFVARCQTWSASLLALKSKVTPAESFRNVHTEKWIICVLAEKESLLKIEENR